MFYGVDKAKNPDNEAEDLCLDQQVRSSNPPLISAPLAHIMMGMPMVLDHYQVYELLKLGEPTAKRIRQLEDLRDAGEMLAEELGFSWDGQGCSSNLNAAIRRCHLQFGAVTTDIRRIWLFTNEDVPPQSGDPSESIRDALKNGISFDLWYSSAPSQQFDVSKFWGHLLKAQQDDELGTYEAEATEGGSATCRDASKPFDRVLDELRHQATVKRRYAKLPFRISRCPSVCPQVALYKVIAPCRVAPAVLLTEGSNEKVMSTQRLLADNGEYVDERSVKTGIHLGHTCVMVTRDEYAKAASFGADEPGQPSDVTLGTCGHLSLPLNVVTVIFSVSGLDLLGFVPVSELTWEVNISSPIFVYPDDTDVQGSTVALIALHGAMVKRMCGGVVAFRRSLTAAPKLGILIPQEETSTMPPGLQLIFTPWLDDLRAVPADSCLPAGEEPCEAAAAVAGKLESSEPYRTVEIPNPALQKHYAILEGLALMERDSRTWDEASDDATQPKSDAMMAVAHEELEVFQNVCGLMDSGKRDITKAVSSSGKRSKREAEVGRGDMDVQKLVEDGALESLTVQELKDIAASLGLTKGGKKADLVERISQSFTK